MLFESMWQESFCFANGRRWIMWFFVDYDARLIVICTGSVDRQCVDVCAGGMTEMLGTIVIIPLMIHFGNNKVHEVQDMCLRSLFTAQ